MNVLATIGALFAAIAMGFAMWDHNMALAVANFNTIVWTVLYSFKPN